MVYRPLFVEVPEAQASPFKWEPCGVSSFRAIIGPYLFRIQPWSPGWRLVIYVTPEGERQKRVKVTPCDNQVDAARRAWEWFCRREDRFLYM
jgi:hypothetical protein